MSGSALALIALLLLGSAGGGGFWFGNKTGRDAVIAERAAKDAATAASEKAQRDAAERARDAEEDRLHREAALAAENEQEARKDARYARSELAALIRARGAGGRCLDEPRRLLVNAAITASRRKAASDPRKPARAVPAAAAAGKR